MFIPPYIRPYQFFCFNKQSFCSWLLTEIDIYTGNDKQFVSPLFSFHSVSLKNLNPYLPRLLEYSFVFGSHSNIILSTQQLMAGGKSEATESHNVYQSEVAEQYQ